MTENVAITGEVRSLKLCSKNSKISFDPFNFSLNKSTPIICITGDSGSGKTTFFRSLIPRFVEEWRGSTQVSTDMTLRRNGFDFTQSNGRIGYASQSPFFVSNQTVIDNLKLPFVWAGLDMPSDTKVSKILDDFHLSPISSRKAFQLSAGERQRLNLARMFLANPDLAIIDECLSSLDERLALQIAKTIAEQYSTSCRVLATGHLRLDLLSISSFALKFTYENTQMTDISRRHIKVTYGRLS
jgi:lipopolysaccharide export system ATP-binding protein